MRRVPQRVREGDAERADHRPGEGEAPVRAALSRAAKPKPTVTPSANPARIPCSRGCRRSTALGTVLPVLRDAGDLRSRFGSVMMAVGAVGEFGPVIAMALSGRSAGESTVCSPRSGC
ncbi:hypothetical protein [Streptomyces fulvoviolaceus]|uniref:hypothetical protein n=1 Tax=Streptomyces fulvoviolaceus TaxID=285535 RepID=UPI0036F228DC